MERIAAARAALAQAYADNPDEVRAYGSRIANIEKARKRERQRFEHLVIGNKRPAPEVKKPAGMSKQEWKVERKRLLAAGAVLEPGIEESVALREAWSHKAYGTPETWERAERTHQGALVQLHRNGVIGNDELEWAAEIANVHRSIEADVAVKVASLEARVDQSRRASSALAESIHRVRMHLAYGRWRERIPSPKAMVLDMLVGEPIGFTVAAKRHRVHNRRAKKALLDAIALWPDCKSHVFRCYGDDEIISAQMAAE